MDIWKWFEKQGIGLKEIAEKTGYSVRYLQNLQNGCDKFNDRVRFRLMFNYPQASHLILKTASTIATQPESSGR